MENRTLTQMVAEALEYGLALGAEDGCLELPDGSGVTSARQYAETGVLTQDSGLVVTLGNGAEFQVTVVCSARPEWGHECDWCSAYFESEEELFEHGRQEHGLEGGEEA